MSYTRRIFCVLALFLVPLSSSVFAQDTEKAAQVVIDAAKEVRP